MREKKLGVGRRNIIKIEVIKHPAGPLLNSQHSHMEWVYLLHHPSNFFQPSSLINFVHPLVCSRTIEERL